MSEEKEYFQNYRDNLFSSKGTRNIQEQCANKVKSILNIDLPQYQVIVQQEYIDIAVLNKLGKKIFGTSFTILNLVDIYQDGDDEVKISIGSCNVTQRTSHNVLILQAQLNAARVVEQKDRAGDLEALREVCRQFVAFRSKRLEIIRQAKAWASTQEKDYSDHIDNEELLQDYKKYLTTV